MIELSDAHAMAIERSCAVTAVALSGRRREGVRLVTGAQRVFSLSPQLDFVHVPFPSIERDWTRRTLTCGVALQCSPSKERLATFRLNELSARELRAITLVEASVALGWIASNWPGLLVESTPDAARPPRVARRHGRRRDGQPGDLDVAHLRAAERSSTRGPIAPGLQRASESGRQVATQLRQNALDHNAETPATPVLRSGRRRRRRA